jgi:hypothetical protein
MTGSTMSFAPAITGTALISLALKCANDRFHMAYVNSFRKIEFLVFRPAHPRLRAQISLSEHGER